MKMKLLRTLLATLAMATLGGAFAQWSLQKAAEPYRGTTIKALFLDRPGYRAAQKLIPEFEKATGIKVTWETLPYETSRERQVLNFTGGSPDLDVILVDVVWIGEFAASGWIVPMEKFYNNSKLADPKLNLKGFFPLVLNSFGTWGSKVYGLPFDNYSGLMFYNKCMLKEAGFDKPPATWDELLKVYGPRLTKPDKGQYAFALQSRRGETQSADSFMRVLWPFGGSLLDPKTFEPNLLSKESQAGLKFRQDLMKYMPPGIVDYDHNEVVQALAQGKVAMITEWSAFWGDLINPKTSKITNCVAVATEPKGPAGLKPALGGFSLAVNAQSDPKKQAAAWLFIQWLTSEAKAKDYVLAGGVSARQSVWEDAQIRKQFPYVEPLVQSWTTDGVPFFRPRFPEWPAISELIAETGTQMMLGKVSTEEGAKILNEKIRDILEKAGYYSGKRPKEQ